MCEWGNQKQVRLCQPREVSGRTTAMVDSCIADAVQRLNDAGIHTLGSCCGHAKVPPNVIVEENGAIKEVKL